MSMSVAQHQDASGRITRHQKPCFPGVFAPSGTDDPNPSSHQDASRGIRKHPPSATQNATRVLPTDPDLAAVIEAWDRLPAAVRAGIVAMVRAASGK
jgi:hypothetical protein